MNRLIVLLFVTFITIFWGISNVAADSSTYDTNGSITFAVDPDNPNEVVTPDNDSGSETTDKVEQKNSTTTHSYEKPAEGVVVSSGKGDMKSSLPDTNATQITDFTLSSVVGILLIILSLLLTNKKIISVGLRGTNQ